MQFLMVLIPIVSFITIERNRADLDKPEVRARISNLYSDIHLTRNQQTVWYYPVFMLRRVIFVAIPTFVYFIPTIQLQVLVFATSTYIMYYSGVRPHTDWKRFKLELFNEIVIMVMCYHLMLFTYFVVDDSTQFVMGYSYVFFLALVFVVNIGQMVAKQVEKWQYNQYLKFQKKVVKAKHIWYVIHKDQIDRILQKREKKA